MEGRHTGPGGHTPVLHPVLEGQIESSAGSPREELPRPAVQSQRGHTSESRDQAAVLDLLHAEFSQAAFQHRDHRSGGTGHC